MAWVAVDKDRTEKIFRCKPFRRCNYRGIGRLFPIVVAKYTKNKRHKWASMWSLDDNDVFPEGCIILPRGSIKKLIGRTLTWEDEPVELKDE